jgi:hypothetical protein
LKILKYIYFYRSRDLKGLTQFNKKANMLSLLHHQSTLHTQHSRPLTGFPVRVQRTGKVSAFVKSLEKATKAIPALSSYNPDNSTTTAGAVVALQPIIDLYDDCYQTCLDVPRRVKKHSQPFEQTVIDDDMVVVNDALARGSVVILPSAMRYPASKSTLLGAMYTIFDTTGDEAAEYEILQPPPKCVTVDSLLFATVFSVTSTIDKDRPILVCHNSRSLTDIVQGTRQSKSWRIAKLLANHQISFHTCSSYLPVLEEQWSRSCERLEPDHDRVMAQRKAERRAAAKANKKTKRKAECVVDATSSKHLKTIV